MLFVNYTLGVTHWEGVIIPSPPSLLISSVQKTLFENFISLPVFEEKINTFS